MSEASLALAAEESARAGTIREVGGDLVDSSIVDVLPFRLERLHRNVSGPMHWHYRQPALALFWYRGGARACDLLVGGQSFRSRIADNSLSIIPADVEIEGEFNTTSRVDYVVAFLDNEFVSRHLGPTGITKPVFAFSHHPLARGLDELCRNAEAPDKVFSLFAEGWACQALALMSRMSEAAIDSRGESNPGLSKRSMRLLEEFVHAHLGQPITLQQMADTAGMGQRSFLRAFRQTNGTSPYQYLLTVRLREAKRLLTDGRESITEIALACGFGNSQHFSSTFRKTTGSTPSKFRRISQT